MKPAAILRSLLTSHKRKQKLHQVDIHSHLLPGIDDGVKNIEQSIEILKGFEVAGFHKVITTPHIKSDYYPNSPEIILNSLKKIGNELSNRGLNIKIEAAAEYYLDEFFLIKLRGEPQDLLSFGNNFILFETSFNTKPFLLNEMIFEMKSKGFQPIMAHPERYTYLNNDWKTIRELKDLGTLFQLNINSLGNFYGKDARKQAEKMVDLKLIDFAGSDCHSMRHLEFMLKTIRSSKYWDKLLKMPLRNDELLD